MQSFDRLTGIAASFPRANVDTDVIIPKQFLKGIDRSGLADGVFFDLRFEKSGASRVDFVLNDPAWANAAFLVVGPNFGCGSSREHAVWGLLQLGIRVLIGTSFAGIFFDNCARNGLLAIRLDPADFAKVEQAAQNPAQNVITIDLAAQTISLDHSGSVLNFEIDTLRKEMILHGEDAIDITLKHADAIRAFEARHFAESRWLEA